MLRSALVAAFVLLPLALLNSSLARAGFVEDRLSAHRCKSQILRELDAWEQKRGWVRGVSEYDGVESFRTPTREIGRWIEADFYPSGVVAAYRITPLSHWKTTFTPQGERSCSVARKRMPQPLDQSRMRRNFSDADVKRLLERGRKGVILAWSPHMPLSVMAIAKAKAAADRLGVKFTAVLDPKAQGTLADAFLRRDRLDSRYLKRIESVELIMRGMHNHYPSLIVYGGGQIKAGLLPGYTGTGVYESFIRERTR